MGSVPAGGYCCWQARGTREACCCLLTPWCATARFSGAGSIYQDELRNTSANFVYPTGRILQALMNFTQGDRLWVVVGQLGIAGVTGACNTPARCPLHRESWIHT